METTMQRSVWIGSAILAVFLSVSGAQAAPVSGGVIAQAANTHATIHTIHGCHQTWARGPHGWHRHGPRCEPRHGVTDQRKRRGKTKRLAA
jgi:hypothetical protein